MTSQHKRILYGRRSGHRLRAGQKRLLEELLPTIRVDLAGEGGVDPARCFSPTMAGVWLEVGFGAGEHMIEQAAAHRDVGIIGCEPFITGIAQALARIDAQELDNVRIYDGDARDLLEALAPACLDRLFLLFPDPWPKRRHHKRRFICDDNVAQLARTLKPGGEFRVASDIPEYVRWTLLHVLRNGKFEWLAEAPVDWRQRPADWPPTRYENKAVAAGRRPSYLRFRRRP
jgi:tRNA (guanine-N7-)-methyltransferase